MYYVVIDFPVELSHSSFFGLNEKFEVEYDTEKFRTIFQVGKKVKLFDTFHEARKYSNLSYDIHENNFLAGYWSCSVLPIYEVDLLEGTNLKEIAYQEENNICFRKIPAEAILSTHKIYAAGKVINDFILQEQENKKTELIP